jgi:Protein of unknown function (DUF3795)
MAQNEFRRDEYCGGYCGACPQFLASENGTLEQLAARRNSTPDETRCHGCKSVVVSGWCRICNLKQCAQKQGLEFCGECDQYPCADLQAFIDDPRYPYHTLVPQNLAAIREKGLDAWLAEQDVRWRCPACGTRHSWYDTTCPRCGGPTRNWAA